MSYWFAPGPVPQDERVQIAFSHRSEEFQSVVLSVRSLLRERMGMDEILVVEGSASAATEAVLYSLTRHAVRGLGMLVNGVFSYRALQWAKKYHPNVLKGSKVGNLWSMIRENSIDMVFAVQFETAVSKLTRMKDLLAECREKQILTVVDAVSGWPYYPLPDADVVITSSSKMLRGLPVLGIVGMRKEVAEKLWDKGGYLSLMEIQAAQRQGRTLHTAMMPQWLALLHQLRSREYVKFVSAVDYNVRAFLGNEDWEGWLVGECPAPVLTVDVGTLDAAEKLRDNLALAGLEVYYNKAYSNSEVQMSMYNYEDPLVYEELGRAVWQQLQEVGKKRTVGEQEGASK